MPGWMRAKRLAVACLACIPLPSPDEPIHREPSDAIEASPARPAAQEHPGETRSSSPETNSSPANAASANALSLKGWIKPPARLDLPLGLDNRLWLGVNAGQERPDNPVPLFLAGGWLSQGLLPGRRRDVLAIGYGHSRLNPQGLPAGTWGSSGREGVLEVNYSWLVNEQLSLQPVVQLILHPDGRSTDPILATGLGFTLRF